MSPSVIAYSRGFGAGSRSTAAQSRSLGSSSISTGAYSCGLVVRSNSAGAYGCSISRTCIGAIPQSGSIISMSPCTIAYGRGLRAGSRRTVSYGRSLGSSSISTGTHSGGIVSRRNSANAGRQSIVAGGTVVEIVVVPLAICFSRGLHTVVMGHGVFQLGQVDGVCVFTAGSYAGDLTAGTAIADGKGPFCGFPGQAATGGRSAGLGVPAGNAAGAVCFRALTQSNGPFHTGFGVFANSYGIFFGFCRIPHGHGRIIRCGAVAYSHCIIPVGGHLGPGGDGVAGGLVEGDGVEFVQIIGLLVVVHRLAVLLVGFRGIAGDFGFGHFFPGGGIFFRIGMDVLRGSGGVAVGVPEHLGHLGGVAAAVLVPGGVVCGRGLFAVFIGVIGYRFVDDFCRIADGGGIVPFGLVVVAYGRGSAGFGGSIQGMGRPFPIHQFGIGFIHGLAFFSGVPFGYVPEGVGVSTDSGIVLAGFIITLCHGSRIANSQISVTIIGSGGFIAQVNFYLS